MSEFLNIPIESPPTDELRLKEWLARMTVLINGALSQVPTQVNLINALEAATSVSQNPTGLDTPLQVNFGVAQENDYVSIDANGTLTFKIAGAYEIFMFANVTGSGDPQTSYIVLYGLKNDVSTGGSWTISIDGNNTSLPIYAVFDDNYEVGDTIKLYIVRDSSGADDGGLSSITPVNGSVPATFSARLIVKKLGIYAIG